MFLLRPLFSVIFIFLVFLLAVAEPYPTLQQCDIMAHLKRGLNNGIQIIAGSSKATVTVTHKDTGELRGAYEILPNSVLHICKCRFFDYKYSFFELRELSFKISGPSVSYNQGCLVRGDVGMAIPQLLALNHSYVPDGAEEGVAYARADPPSLRTLAKAVVRGYRLDCHLQPDSLPASLQEELKEIDEQHEEALDLQSWDRRGCPCAGDRYALFPIYKRWSDTGNGIDPYGEVWLSSEELQEWLETGLHCMWDSESEFGSESDSDSASETGMMSVN